MTAFMLFLAAAGVLLALDGAGKINLLHPLPLTLYLPLALNIPLGAFWFYRVNPAGFPVPLRAVSLAWAGICIFYVWIRLNVFPARNKRKILKKEGSFLDRAGRFRLSVMIGGRYLVYAGLWAVILELPLLTVSWLLLRRNGEIPNALFIGNAVYGILTSFFILGNGVVRIFCTSKRLGLFRRIIILLTMWIPPLNVIVLLYACRLVYEEYDFALYKANLHLVRAEKDICKTRYPLVMVHGILFRDLKYFNYWGRIPRELIRNGASVYYGSQEAVGTVADNAGDLRDRILSVLEETGAEKVNIIAHSKGGLDSRYAISILGMADKVASLTTISTPHRGCRFVDRACALPGWVYRFTAKCFDGTFRRLGDKNPNFYTATRQFATASSEEFNKTVPDVPGVYYQSFMSRMKSASSDPLLSLTYRLIRSMEGDNDGLVSTASAVWGEFRGTVESETGRGISHGDIIDLKRTDYRGFDVIEYYIRMVAELKEKGY
ncbi:MAG: hypothetical protein LBK77_01965 [Spirochaetaceae bacterium]|jgi:triacylglycerol lipase|nr:hypothetical protein [Spirochaetaceae bacterium]